MGGDEKPSWPEWWEWELEFTAHVEERMLMRGFSEVELRTMLQAATALTPARRSGRWLASTRRAGRAWVVVVEPDEIARKLLVVTAYPRGA